MKWPGTKNSGPNLRSFQFLIGGIFGRRQSGLLLDEIPAMCLRLRHMKAGCTAV